MVARLTRTLGSRHLAMAEDAVQAAPARDTLERYPLLPAVEAELWREAGDRVRAAASYRSALTLARPAPEQRWLTTRLTHLV